MSVNQAPHSVLMVRPNYFQFNPETAASNSFQQSMDMEDTYGIRARAIREFDELVLTLKTSGIDVIEFNSDGHPESPDAVFPNNWVSFHHDGKVILYPMMAPSRRLERRFDIIAALEKQHHFMVNEVIDLSHFEEKGHFLEGTGSMVMDYINGVIYANHSPRTSTLPLNKAADVLGYKVFQFVAVDNTGQEIYHTNVFMCIGSGYAVVCLEAVGTKYDRNRLVNSLEAHGHEVMDITIDQMNHFAGNMMELLGIQGNSILAMSENAYRCLTVDQVARLSKYSDIIYSPIDTIEKYGGGSVRCMLAGIYLPRHQP